MNSSRFLSPNGFPTGVFGPPLWRSLHLITANVPLVPTKKESEQYYRLFESLCTVIPCKYCRTEFCKMVKTGPLRLRSSLFLQKQRDRPGAVRKRVFTWLVRLHNRVNRRLGKRHASGVGEWATYYAGFRKT